MIHTIIKINLLNQSINKNQAKPKVYCEKKSNQSNAFKH